MLVQSAMPEYQHLHQRLENKTSMSFPLFWMLPIAKNLPLLNRTLKITIKFGNKISNTYLYLL